MRKPFQGVLNIIRFNWHFYILSLGLLLLLFIVSTQFGQSFKVLLYFVSIGILYTNIVSLLVSYYVYDLSGLYNFDWLEVLETDLKVINISAGFDETSTLLKDKFPKAELLALDFYDPLKHTEVSIKRARKAYPSFPGTIPVKTTSLLPDDNSADKIFVILSAHEIRNDVERIEFFKELRRIIKPAGEIIIVEHLRDTANFLAYNIGFFHFFSLSVWSKTFHAAHLQKDKTLKITPFISTFILRKNGNTF